LRSSISRRSRFVVCFPFAVYPRRPMTDSTLLQEGDLNFSRGDVLFLLEKTDENWYESPFSSFASGKTDSLTDASSP
jgi:hypothetical protein